MIIKEQLFISAIVFGTVILVVGLCLIVAGVVLAVVLKRRARS